MTTFTKKRLLLAFKLIFRGELSTLFEHLEVVLLGSLARKIRLSFFTGRFKNVYAILLTPVLKTKQPTNQISKERADHSVTILLPIYGQIDLVKILAENLRNTVNQTNVFLNVIDDAKDLRSSELIDKIFRDFPNTKITKNPKNIGYLKSINFAFKSIQTEYAILLNSDVELPENWLPRMLEPFRLPKVALATALATNSGANLTIKIPEGRSWQEVDGWISKHQPKYPNACTAIGYLMAIRVESVDNRDELFSTDFIDGYGEDSDLHYRMITRGFKSVVVDNLLVHHESGASYDLKKNVKEIKKTNMERFLDKWGPEHKKELAAWEKSKALRNLRRIIKFFNLTESFDCDFLVILPSDVENSGGIRVAIALAKELLRTGYRTRIVSVHKMNSRNNYAPSMKVASLSNVGEVKNVIMTGVGTFELGNNLSQRLKANSFIFFQGPEQYFENGLNYSLVSKTIQKATAVICVSPFLMEIAIDMGAKIAHTSNFGPNTNLYYSNGVQKKDQILLSSRIQAEKGALFASRLAAFLIQDGWAVKAFGPTHPVLYEIAGLEILGELSVDQLRDLYCESKYVIDFSLFEGLGLVPLEAALCACVPIVTRKGGLESVNDKSVNSFYWLESLQMSNHQMTTLSNDLKIRKNDSFKSANMSISLERGLHETIKTLEKYCEKR